MRAQPRTRGREDADIFIGKMMLEEELSFAVYSAMLAFNRAHKAFLKPLNLTYSQYLVMLILWQRDNVTVGAIGERLSLDSATLTPLLKRLEAAGRIQRARDQIDERHVLITLTDDGRALGTAAKSISLNISRATGLDRQVMERLRVDLIQLRRYLNAAD